MADQFKIDIVTLADLTGIKLTQQQLEALQKSARQGNQESIDAIGKLQSAMRSALDPGQLSKQISGLLGSFGTGLIGGLAVVGPALGAIYNGFRKLNDEMDAWADKAIAAAEKTRELNLALIDATEWSEKLSNIRELPIADRVAAYRHELERLKTELSLTNPATQAEDWKKLNQQIAQVTNALNGANAAQQRFNQQEAERARRAEQKNRTEGQSLLEGAVAGSSADTRAIVANEQAAANARAAGRDREADQFQKTADQLRRSNPVAGEEADALEKAMDKFADKIIIGMRTIWGY